MIGFHKHHLGLEILGIKTKVTKVFIIAKWDGKVLRTQICMSCLVDVEVFMENSVTGSKQI